MGQLFSWSKQNDSRNTATNATKNNSNRGNINNPHVNKPQISEKDQAILDLKNARDRLKKWRKKLSIETETLQNQAKQLVKQGLKDRALLVIKLRKHKESFTATIDNQLLTVLKQIEDVEWAAINVDVFKAIKAGTDMLNKIHNEISIEEVEALMDETKEAIDIENQISAILSSSGNIMQDWDESELMEELMGLGNPPTSSLNSTKVKEETLVLPEVPTNSVTALPEVPTSPIDATSKVQEKNSDIQERVLISA